MGFLDIFRQKKERSPSVESEEMLQLREQKRLLMQQQQANALELMVKQQELKLREIQVKIDEIDDQYEDEDEFSPENMFMNIVQKAIPQFQAPTGVNPSKEQSVISTPNAGGLSLTDEQLKQYWDTVPAHYKLIAKGMSDEQIKEFIKQKQPNLDANTLERAILVIRA